MKEEGSQAARPSPATHQGSSQERVLARGSSSSLSRLGAHVHGHTLARTHARMHAPHTTPTPPARPKQAAAASATVCSLSVHPKSAHHFFGACQRRTSKATTEPRGVTSERISVRCVIRCPLIAIGMHGDVGEKESALGQVLQLHPQVRTMAPL